MGGGGDAHVVADTENNEEEDLKLQAQTSKDR